MRKIILLATILSSNLWAMHDHEIGGDVNSVIAFGDASSVAFGADYSYNAKFILDGLQIGGMVNFLNNDSLSSFSFLGTGTYNFPTFGQALPDAFFAGGGLGLNMASVGKLASETDILIAFYGGKRFQLFKRLSFHRHYGRNARHDCRYFLQGCDVTVDCFSDVYGNFFWTYLIPNQ